uniref:Uncharacterized protein n=1 Tax=viral metagenome TaxID=1070528 RepID=A0A6C0C1N3_9ZZZZ
MLAFVWHSVASYHYRTQNTPGIHRTRVVKLAVGLYFALLSNEHPSSHELSCMFHAPALTTSQACCTFLRRHLFKIRMDAT